MHYVKRLAKLKNREKNYSASAQSLSDAELLAIFLRTGVKGCHVVDLARNLLKSFGSIAKIYQADLERFCQHHGLRSCKICAVTSLFRNV